MKKTKKVHARRHGTKRPLCGKLQGKVASDADLVTCTDCGREAQRIVSMMVEQVDEEYKRQAQALASAQPPRWWEKTDG